MTVLLEVFPSVLEVDFACAREPDFSGHPWFGNSTPLSLNGLTVSVGALLMGQGLSV